jgi:hypothetical protein
MPPVKQGKLLRSLGKIAAQFSVQGLLMHKIQGLLMHKTG